jgi:hypothetical protein
MGDKEALIPEIQKEKVTELEYIFEVINGKPYYSLKYKKVDENYYHVGYSSYDFRNVLEWEKEYFELVKENYKETIKKLRYPELPDGLVMVDSETRQEAIKALEKQIPMKPIGDLHSAPHYRCPACNSAVVLYEDSPKLPCCQWCGQKLDWEDANGK